MSRKILTIIILLNVLMFPIVRADDFFDNYAGIEHAWDGQKPITNQEFEDAIKVIEGNKKQKEEKQRKKKIKKLSGGGTSLHSNLDPMQEIQSQEPIGKNDKSMGELLNIPVSIIVGNDVLEPGYYGISVEKDVNDNKLYLLFYQAHSLLGKLPAIETCEDDDAETINFVKIIPFNDNYLKILYGSLDYNVFVYVPYYHK